MTSTPRAYTHFPSQADLFYFCTTEETSEDDLDITYAPPSRSSLKIGVLVLGQAQLQLLDLAAVDMLCMISRNRLSKFNAPEIALEESVDEVDIRYINESGEGSFPVTSGSRMPVTNSFDNAPQLDLLVIPGSFSTDDISAAATSFITTQTSHPYFIAVLSIASGMFPIAQTSLLHQKRATGPPSLLSSLRQQFPETSWQDTPWIQHDNIWSSSSAVTAINMLAAWMRQYFWDRSEAVECALRVAGIPRLDTYS